MAFGAPIPCPNCADGVAYPITLGEGGGNYRCFACSSTVSVPKGEKPESKSGAEESAR